MHIYEHINMKNNKKLSHQQRQILDLKVQNLIPVGALKNNWIKSVRNSLGISIRQLAQLLKISPSSLGQLESGELKKSISLKSLSRVAEAMNCELVYMIIPKAPFTSYDEILEQKALDLAQKISKGVTHSMALEQQKVSTEISHQQIKNLAQDLKRNLDVRLWSTSSKSKNKK